jgi:hypothetical protein
MSSELMQKFLPVMRILQDRLSFKYLLCRRGWILANVQGQSVDQKATSLG